MIASRYRFCPQKLVATGGRSWYRIFCTYGLLLIGAEAVSDPTRRQSGDADTGTFRAPHGLMQTHEAHGVAMFTVCSGAWRDGLCNKCGVNRMFPMTNLVGLAIVFSALVIVNGEAAWTGPIHAASFVSLFHQPADPSGRPSSTPDSGKCGASGTMPIACGIIACVWRQVVLVVLAMITVPTEK